MDVSTIAGLLGGIALLAIGIRLGHGTPLQFFSVSSVLIVLGGTVASTMVAFPMERVAAGLRLLLRTLRTETSDPTPLVALMASLTRKARREGLLALESELGHMPCPFLRRGLTLLVDGSDPATLREVLENDIRTARERHDNGRAVVEHMGRVAPAFGMVGTLIGLVTMLHNLGGRPEILGGALAVALMTTLYGVLLAWLVFNPMASKLLARSEEEATTRRMLLEGLLSIQCGENPSVLVERLSVYLPPERREESRSLGVPTETMPI